MAKKKAIEKPKPKEEVKAEVKEELKQPEKGKDPVPEPSEMKVPDKGLQAAKDINKLYRKGSMVPKSQIDEWENMGIDWKVWF